MPASLNYIIIIILLCQLFFIGGDDQIRTGDGDFADLCLTAWRRRLILINGAQRRNRTTDTGIFSPLLYRLSYLGVNGGSDEARTRDLLRDRQAL